ncbi:MAG: metallophosphoesterase [Treponema sp.]|nr:metallophosphoesterase [Treponema sp.]
MKKASMLTAVAAMGIAALSLLAASCKPIELGLYKVFDHGPNVSERIGSLRDDVPAPQNVMRSGRFSFVVTSDVHFGNAGKSYARDDEAFYRKVQELKDSMEFPPSFVVCLGDVVEKGDDRSEWADYRDWCDRLERMLGNKVYTTTGNHDLYNDGWDYFEDYTYPGTGFFRFAVAGFSFYFLDSGSGSLGSSQYDKFQKALKGDGRPKIICTHYPVYGTAQFFQNYYTLQNTEEADTLITLCAKNNVRLYLAGHMHEQHENNLGSFTELVMPCYAVYHKFAVVTVDVASATVDWEFVAY